MKHYHQINIVKQIVSVITSHLHYCKPIRAEKRSNILETLPIALIFTVFFLIPPLVTLTSSTWAPLGTTLKKSCLAFAFSVSCCCLFDPQHMNCNNDIIAFRYFFWIRIYINGSITTADHEQIVHKMANEASLKHWHPTIFHTNSLLNVLSYFIYLLDCII